MKSKTILNFLTLILITVNCAAQIPSPHRKVVPNPASSSQPEPSGNVTLNLKVYANGEVKGNIAFQIINKETTFSIDHVDLSGKMKPLQFSGSLSPIDKETHLIKYTFSQRFEIVNGNSTRGGNSGWSVSTEIKKGTEVVLMKNIDFSYTLEIGGDLNKSE